MRMRSSRYSARPRATAASTISPAALRRARSAGRAAAQPPGRRRRGGVSGDVRRHGGRARRRISWCSRRARSTAPVAPGALAVGRARTPPCRSSISGGSRRSTSSRRACARRLRDAGIEAASDVHFVQIKCPLLTADRIAEAEARGATTATRDTLKSMGFSRAASALGVAVALGEVDRDRLTEEAIGRDWSLYSSRASTSAGVELTDHEIVVLGDRAGMERAAAHRPLRDARRHRHRAGARRRWPSSASRARTVEARRKRGRLVALLAKAEAGSTGRCAAIVTRCSTIPIFPSTRHARAFVAGALAGLVGHAEIYVSGGAEHQGPDGGGPVAIIAEQALSSGDARHDRRSAARDARSPPRAVPRSRPSA